MEQMQSEKEPVEVLAKPHGPIVVMSDLLITKPDGTTELRKGKTSFCGCGASAKKPFCDGSHKTLNIVDPNTNV